MVLRYSTKDEPQFDALESPPPVYSKREKPHIALQKIRNDIDRTKEDTETSTQYERWGYLVMVQIKSLGAVNILTNTTMLAGRLFTAGPMNDMRS